MIFLRHTRMRILRFCFIGNRIFKKKNNIILFILGRKRAAYEEEHSEIRCTGLCHHSEAS